MATIRVQNSNVNNSKGFKVTMFWQESGHIHSKIIRRENVWHTGTGFEVMARITPSPSQREKIIDAIASGRIKLSDLDNIGADHGGTTEISLGK